MGKRRGQTLGYEWGQTPKALLNLEGTDSEPMLKFDGDRPISNISNNGDRPLTSRGLSPPFSAKKTFLTFNYLSLKIIYRFK